MTCPGCVTRRARFAVVDRTEAGLQWMRRVTQWTLLSVAGLVVLIPAGDLFARDDLSPAAIGVAFVALAFVGYVQTRLLMGGMAGLHDAPRSLPLVGRRGGGRARAVGRADRRGVALDVGAAVLRRRLRRGLRRRTGRSVAGRRRRLSRGVRRRCARRGRRGGDGRRLRPGFFRAGLPPQVWIWDVTLRLDGAREQAGEVAVLRERLRFAGDLHDIQGHQLQAIALKAQLAARLIGVDDEAARGHAQDAHGPGAAGAVGDARARPGLPARRARDETGQCGRDPAGRGRRRRGRGRRRNRSRSRCSRCSGRSCARARRTCSATPAPRAARSRSSATATTSSCA